MFPIAAIENFTFVFTKYFLDCYRYQNGLFREQRQVEQRRYGLPQVAYAIRWSDHKGMVQRF